MRTSPPTAPQPAPRVVAAPRQRRKDARPQELLDAALALFVDKGFAATRSEEVAARAGVAKGTLYRYYPSKEELFKAVVRHHLSARIAESAELAAQHRGSVAELLRQMMQAWWQRVGQGAAGGIGKVMLVEARNFPELARFYVDEVINPSHALISSLVERGMRDGEFRAVNVDATVHMLIAPLMQMMLNEHSFGAQSLCGFTMTAAEMLEAQMSLLLRGLLAAPHPEEGA